MRFEGKKVEVVEGDLTPMIDMTFQLIAFFMVLINFGQTESHDLVVLPSSVLVKPPDVPFEFPIILHVGTSGQIALGGERMTLATLRPYLNLEKAVIDARGLKLSDATVIIRAHRDCPTGFVQEVVASCQQQGFDSFALRVKEEIE